MFQRFNPALKLVESLSADQTSRAAHDSNVMLTFDFVSQFHDVIHTRPARKKFPLGLRELDDLRPRKSSAGNQFFAVKKLGCFKSLICDEYIFNTSRSFVTCELTVFSWPAKA